MIRVIGVIVPRDWKSDCCSDRGAFASFEPIYGCGVSLGNQDLDCDEDSGH